MDGEERCVFSLHSNVSTVLIIFPLILQTIITAQMTSIGGEGELERPKLMVWWGCELWSVATSDLCVQPANVHNAQ